jgi:hypothetical protein
MPVRYHSIQTLAARGLIPSVVYSAQNPDRARNPNWNFSTPRTLDLGLVQQV